MADEVATAEETPGAEEVSNPDAPAAESKEESNEPNDDAKTGVKYKGVVNWFNVAKGFGELAWQSPSSKYFFLVRHGRVPASPRDPRALPRLFCHPNANTTRYFGF